MGNGGHDPQLEVAVDRALALQENPGPPLPDPAGGPARWRRSRPPSVPGGTIITENLFSTECFHAIRVVILRGKPILRAIAASNPAYRINRT